MNWLYYLLEANIYLSVFYLLYYLLLSRDTNYTLNRFYLLSTSCIAFVIPVFQIGILKPLEPQTEEAAYVIESVVQAQLAQAPKEELQFYNWPLYLYLVGVFIVALLFLIRLISLYRLSVTKTQYKAKGYRLIYLGGVDTAFSFFNYLFIGSATKNTDTIIRHEEVHIRQKHSADVLFTELLKAVNWFNPVVYLLQKSLKVQHEYIADAQTADDNLSYSSFLVNNAYGSDGFTISNSFFNNKLLKKRIIMLNKQRSGKLARLKYLLAVPLCAGMLCASTLSFSKNYGVDLLPQAAEIKQEQKVKPQPTLQVSDTIRKKEAILKKSIPEPKITQIKFPQPLFKGSPFKTLLSHLYSNVKYPAKQLQARKEGTVTVAFTVNNDGYLVNPFIENGWNAESDAEALRAVNQFSNKVGTAKPGDYKLLFWFAIPKRAGKKSAVVILPEIAEDKLAGAIRVIGVPK